MDDNLVRAGCPEGLAMENVPLLIFVAWVIHQLTASLRAVSCGPIRIEFYERRRRKDLPPGLPAERSLPPADRVEDPKKDGAGGGADD